MAKRLILILAALLAAAVILLHGHRQALVQAYAREYQGAYHRLDEERREIEEQLDALEESKRARQLCAMGMFLAEKPQQRVYTEMYPLLEEYGYTAALALSPEAYPGQPDCITEKQFQELLEKGWSVCAAWDGEAPLSELKAVFSGLGIPKPDVVLVESGSYSTALDAELKKAGYKVVIHHGEELPFFQEPDAPVLRHFSGAFWNYPNIAAYLEAAVQDHEILVLTVDFATAFGDMDERLFRNMCGFMAEHEEAFPLEDLAQATVVDEREEAYYQERKAFLQEELDRCDRQIEKLYEVYQQYNPDNRAK